MGKNVLVLGAHGMLGHVAVKTFEENGYDVLGVALEGDSENVLAIDVLSSADLMRLLYVNDFDVVINCIGVLNQNAEQNPDLAIYLNSYLPHQLERFYKDTKTKIIQPSTDCVFAGNTGPYTEASHPDGMTFYDRTKALGELNNDKDVTLRMSIVGPDINEGGIGLLNWFLKQHGDIYGFTGAMWTGITTVELARGMVAAVEQNITGLYHYVPKTNISKYDMLVLFAEVFDKKDVNIIPKDEPKIDKSLVGTRTDFDRVIPGYREMFIDMREWMERHRALYPHYTWG